MAVNKSNDFFPNFWAKLLFCTCVLFIRTHDEQSKLVRCRIWDVNQNWSAHQHHRLSESIRITRLMWEVIALFGVYFAIYLCIMHRHKWGMRANQPKNRSEEKHSNYLPEINIFRVICLVFSFKLTKWMCDNYVWCSNDCDRQTHMIIVMIIIIPASAGRFIALHVHDSNGFPHKFLTYFACSKRVAINQV